MKSKSDDEKTSLREYLKSLGQDELDQILNQVLVELRGRESDQLKKDVLTHSQQLRLYRRES